MATSMRWLRQQFPDDPSTGGRVQARILTFLSAALLCSAGCASATDGRALVDAARPDAAPHDAGVMDARGEPDGPLDGGATPSPDSGSTDGGTDAGADASTPTRCVTLGSAPIVVARAAVAEEHVLALRAAAGSSTLWSRPGHEAVILEVTSEARGLIGHLVLHQGRTWFRYGMHVGRLEPDDAISVAVSALSATGSSTASACLDDVALTPGSALEADGLARAPIFRWPVQKRFDDVPLLVGWSAATQTYEAVYSSENGGTVHSCGGGASGVRALFARWGRGCDIERVVSYGETPTWARCTGDTRLADVAPRQEGSHPVFYFGDSHNRLYEHRGGYGQACGTGAAERTDGDLDGWNRASPGNDEADDAGRVIVLRPVPVDLDALGYAAHRGRREALVDRYAPWIYRLTFQELAREGRIDGDQVLPMEHYLFVDVHAANVDGSGDGVCSSDVSKGFRLRVLTTEGTVISGPQVTASYFGADPGWKRVAIPLGEAFEPADLEGLIFDAYDNDGIYFLSLGDVFMLRPERDNDARIVPLVEGPRAVDVYVDDDRGGCSSSVNRDGPAPIAYPCTGSDYLVRF